MSKTEWNDCTTYSRGDKERVPTCFEIKHGWLRICITSDHIYHRPNYVLHCHALGIDSKSITVMSRKFNADDPVEIVQARALEIIEARLDQIRDDMIIIKRVAAK